MDKNDIVKSLEDCSVRIETDEDPTNPRTEWDNVAVFVCSHDRYALGDTGHGYHHKDYSSWHEMKKALIKKEKPIAVLDLYMLDHSGLTVSTNPDGFRAADPQGWDWGQIGLVFIRKNHPGLKGIRRLSERAKRATEIIESEVAVYDQYLRGDVWSWIIATPDDKCAESCSGFYGYEYAKGEGIAAFDAFMEARASKRCAPMIAGGALNVLDMELTLGARRPDGRAAGSITRALPRRGNARSETLDAIETTALSVIESVVLAHACAGVDVTDPKYAEGVETALDAIANNMEDANA